jgi:signal transduction histidine kinase
LVIEEGQTGDTLYLVLEGGIEVSTRRGGQDVQLAVLGRGEVIGEMAVLQQRPRTASVRTLRDSRLLVITQAMFLKMLMRNAGALREILRTFAERVRTNESTVMQQARMASLGTLAAGLAHQLNNPAAAIVRSAAHLREALSVWENAVAEVSRPDLPPDQRAELDRLWAEAHAALSTDHSALDVAPADPLARSDREEQLRSWLAAQGVDDAAGGWDLVEPLVAAGWDEQALSALDGLGEGLPAGGLAAVLRRLAATAASHRTLHEIATSASGISEVVQAVRSYSYLDRAPVQNVDLRDGLENSLVMLRHKLPAGVRVVRQYGDDVPRIEAYGGELNQVWAILIDNAIDAMGPQGELTLRTYLQGDDVVVEVRDSGPGIPPEVQARIFDPFFTTKSQGSGTGLGLHIARRIVVERAQGQITVTSTPGDTCFQVRLPIRLTSPELGDQVLSPKS